MVTTSNRHYPRCSGICLWSWHHHRPPPPHRSCPNRTTQAPKGPLWCLVAQTNMIHLGDHNSAPEDRTNDSNYTTERHTTLTIWSLHHHTATRRRITSDNTSEHHGSKAAHFNRTLSKCSIQAAYHIKKQAIPQKYFGPQQIRLVNPPAN